MRTRAGRPLFAVLVALFLGVPSTAAPWEDEYEDDGIRQAVARLSWFEGDVSFNRGDDPDDWQLAAVNYPLTLGDRLWAGRDARAELQLTGANLFLAPESEVGFLDLTRDYRLLSLTWGTATIRVRALESEEDLELSTPNASVTFGGPGVYRIDVDDDGNTRVGVVQGRAWVAAGGGRVRLEQGDRLRVWGLDRPEYDVVSLGRSDSWDRWVEKRSRRLRTVRSAPYVHPDIYGLDDLDAWGSWESSSEWGWVWFPRTTAAGWVPYHAGRWIWRDPWGWTWLSDEPWGWAPYHHGRWVLHGGRWAWVPIGPTSRHSGWFPALVGFVGGGPGWGPEVGQGGYVGWFPLAPRDPFFPWWYRSRRFADAPPHRYAHRERVVVLPRQIFTRGHWADRDVVRDERILHDLAGAPILRGPLPAVPERDTIRSPRGTSGGATTDAPPRRPPARSVVTRRDVPAAPAPFERKVGVIRERGGEPIRPDETRRFPSEGTDRPVAPVRPVTRGEVVLAPRGTVAPSRRPEALPTAPPPPAMPTVRPTTDPASFPPTPAPRREPEAIRPTPAPRAVATPLPRRVDVPTPRPTPDLAPPAPTRPVRREGAPTPKPPVRTVRTAGPRTEPVPTTAPRRGTVAAPTPAPRIEVAPTPARRVAPAEPRRATEVPPARDEGGPRGDVRSRSTAERPAEAKPADRGDSTRTPDAVPTKAPPRRIAVTPVPG